MIPNSYNIGSQMCNILQQQQAACSPHPESFTLMCEICYWLEIY